MSIGVEAALDGRSFLVVEDEPLVALDIESVLTEDGSTVWVAPNINRALALLSREPVSAAVLDLRLTDRDSTPLCQRLAALHVPFVLYTGVDEAHLASFRRRWPAAPVVAKPALPRVLLGAVIFALAANPLDGADAALPLARWGEDALVTATRRVVVGEERLRRIRLLIARLSERGYDVSAAEDRLRAMTRSLDQLRDRRRSLALDAWTRPVPAQGSAVLARNCAGTASSAAR